MRGVPILGARWLDAAIEAAKAVWYLFLRKSRFVEPMFARVGSRPAVERGHADVRRHPHRRLAEYPQFASEDPILRTLRQRAVLELFEWLGLEQIPKSYWRLLERVGDPARALTAFISNSGFDAKLVRKRDATALAAFQGFVRFVCQVEEVTDLVSDQQRTLLDRYMYYGEHVKARSLLELFATLNEAVELFERWPGPPFAAFAMRARWAATLREHATQADLPEAKALLEASRRHAQLMWRFRNAEDRKERIEAAAREQREGLMPHDQAIWADVLSDLAQARSALMDDAVCDVQRQLEDFERSVERLVILSDELSMQGGDTAGPKEGRQREEQARREEEAHRQQEQRNGENEYVRSDLNGREARSLSRDELLSIFGFPPDALPELSALRQAFIREAGKTQPIFGQPDYRQRNDRFRILKDSYERLKIALE